MCSRSFDREKPEGVIVQLGGQTPLKLTRPLEAAGVKILGTSPDSIDIAEDRRRFEKIARELGLSSRRTARRRASRKRWQSPSASDIRCSCVRRTCLADARCRSCTTRRRCEHYFATAARVSEERPVLIDRFLEDAFECDVDAISDGTRVVIGGIMQHIEDAGIHSGDSACVLPPYLIGETDMQTMREQTVALAHALGVVGLINVQYAIKDGVVYVLEVNPRASRTIPFVSKAIGVPLASLAARVMMGETLDEIGFTEEIIPPYVSVKEAVFPFNKFPGTDPVLGPEMRSTGECMGISDSFGSAFAKSQLAASNGLPLEGVVLITVIDSDKPTVTPIARRFHEMGFKIMATAGTAAYLRARGIPAKRVFKVHEGRPNCLDMIVNRDVAAADQHADGQTRAARRLSAATSGDRQSRVVHDDDVGGERGVRRDPVAQVATAARAVASGVAGGRGGVTRCEPKACRA